MYKSKTSPLVLRKLQQPQWITEAWTFCTERQTIKILKLNHLKYYGQLLCYLTQWSRVLLEKLTGSKLVKKFPTFYRTWRFITTVTCTCHPSLSWASSIQSTPPHPTSWRSILILTSIYAWVSPVVSYPPKPCTCLSPPPYALHAPTISFFLTSDDYCCTKVTATDNCFHWKGQDKVW